MSVVRHGYQPLLLRNSTSVPGISDHNIIVTDIDTKPMTINQPKRKCYLFSRANWQGLNDSFKDLSDNIQKLCHERKDVNDLWNLFRDTIKDNLDNFIPSRMRGGKQKSPSINRDLKRMLKKKQRLFIQARKSRNWDNYRHFQRECKKAIRRAEWSHVNNIIEEGFKSKNTKPFWHYIKCRRQDNIGIAPLKENTTLYSDSKSKARILIEQFRSVFTPEDNSTLPAMEKSNCTPIDNIKITSAGVAKLLKSINPAKACGPDSIPNVVLKNCADTLAPALATIFQLSLDSGTLPSDWKKANISCVFKKGDKHQASNYRPVSLTSVCCKLLEHVVRRHLMCHLEKTNILTNLNHGYRSGFSCETQLLTTLDDLLKSYDQGKQTDVAILDFSKAFDTVPHRKLLYKLKNYGINGTIHTWLKNFLTKCSMKVVLEGESSEEVQVESGVPQGTVLGPILFLCHINDLPLSVKSQVRLFADDCLLYRNIESQQDHVILQNDLKNLEKWASDWGMRFNAKKCYILSIRTKFNYLFYSLDNCILKQVTSNPYLGLQISEDLKWHTHICNITSRASSILGFLHRNLNNCSKDCRKMAYLSLIRSTLEYGSIVWNSQYKSDIERLERFQNCVARFITKDYKSRTPGSMTSLLEQLQLPLLQERRKQLRLIFLYKVVEELVPAVPPEEFLKPKQRNKRQIRAKRFSNCVTNNIVSRSETCNTKAFEIPRSYTDQYKQSFFVNTLLDWNHLDESVVSATTIDSFKNKLLHQHD